jgi:16S rRNA (cytidine1402-2'-O)-methyltransferase
MKLYIVATPIGNLKDITYRAVEVLGSVDLILCEDTRVTRKLLSAYNINTPTHSYNAHASDAKEDKIIELLREGKNIALVSDAGTPGISDPGCMLVGNVRKELPECEIVSIPGASAVTSALSISGVPSSEFLFLGFLPHKKGRETLFKEIANSERPVVFYESPHRIEKSLESLMKFCPEKKVYIGRELTKVFEQMVSGTAEELAKYFKENQDKVRGEFVVIVQNK